MDTAPRAAASRTPEPAQPAPVLPKVSAITSWYNRAEYLRDTLDGLLAQNYGNLEILVINDGSPDPKVREILDSYDDPRLRVIHQANTGLVPALRRAVSESSGEFIAIQGAGDVSAPHRLALQADFLTRHPDYAIVGCGYRSAKIPVTPDRSRAGAGHNWDLAPGAAPPARGTLVRSPTGAELCEANAFTHGEVMIRRSHYEAVGGYRTFFANSQDLDLWLRLSEHYKLGVLGEFMYERRIFLGDGIAGDLKKSLRQLAYSRTAAASYAERAQGVPDRVDRYGPLALMQVPKDLTTLKRVLRLVKQVKAIGDLDLKNLAMVRDLYGWRIYGPAYAYGAYLMARYGDKAPPKRRA